MERCIKFINKNAYIEISIAGTSFITSARNAMRLLWANAGRVSLIAGIGGMFIFIGKLFISLGTVLVCYLIFTNMDPYMTEMTSTFWPLVFIFIISFTVGIIFLAVYSMAIDCILLCFLHDEEDAKGKGNEKPAHCPDTLAKFFEEHEVKDTKKD